MAKVFIAGATGYTGRALVEVALARGHHVVAHIRPGSRSQLAAHFSKLGATVDRTPWEPAALQAALASLSPELVFGLLGTTKSKARAAVKAGESAAANSYDAVDRGLTLMLLEAAERAAPQARFVYLSSMGVSERAPGAYMAARWAVESRLRDCALAWTVARPSFITGPDRDESRYGERIGAAVSDSALKTLAAIGLRGPYARYGSMNGGQLAESLLGASLDPDCVEKVLETDDLRRFLA